MHTWQVSEGRIIAALRDEVTAAEVRLEEERAAHTTTQRTAAAREQVPPLPPPPPLPPAYSLCADMTACCETCACRFDNFCSPLNKAEVNSGMHMVQCTSLLNAKYAHGIAQHGALVVRITGAPEQHGRWGQCLGQHAALGRGAQPAG